MNTPLDRFAVALGALVEQKRRGEQPRRRRRQGVIGYEGERVVVRIPANLRTSAYGPYRSLDGTHATVTSVDDIDNYVYVQTEDGRAEAVPYAFLDALDPMPDLTNIADIDQWLTA